MRKNENFSAHRCLFTHATCEVDMVNKYELITAIITYSLNSEI